MKNLAVYITGALALIFFWAAWQSFGLVAHQAAWRNFCKANAALEKYACLSSSFETSFDPAGGIIFKIPSVAADNSMIRGAFDRALAECGAGMLKTTLVPSGESFRKEATQLFSGFTTCNLTCGGALAYFQCVSGKNVFSKIYTYEQGFLPLPQQDVK